MTLPIDWTAERDRKLLELRGIPLGWNKISAALMIGRNSCIERARRLGVPKRTYGPRTVEQPASPARSSSASDNEANAELDVVDGALRPGHAHTWGAITAGTYLEGSPFRRP